MNNTEIVQALQNIYEVLQGIGIVLLLNVVLRFINITFRKEGK